MGAKGRKRVSCTIGGTAIPPPPDFQLPALFVDTQIGAGSGTHFEHYKYGIMLTIISINYVVLKRQSKLRLAKQYQNPIKRS